MPIDVGVWRVDQGVEAIRFKDLEQESDLQQMIADDISMVDPRLMVIGREVMTEYGGRVDLLAIDADGNLVAIELKRDRTPRDVVAQILDYGSWVRRLKAEEIAEKFIDYQERFLKVDTPKSIDNALRERFDRIPDSFNSSHSLIIVAGSLDPSTERIVTYLIEQYGVEINVVFFRIFEDDDRQYLTRAWLQDPSGSPSETAQFSTISGPSGESNGEFSVSYGPVPHRSWPDAKKYGFISAGGGEWYVKTLRNLQPGNRIWVNVPGTGYVGVGEVLSPAVRAEHFQVRQAGIDTPISQIQLESPVVLEDHEDEHFVGVNWIKTVELQEAVWETGFFANQNTVTKPKVQKWHFTVERLKSLWKVQ